MKKLLLLSSTTVLFLSVIFFTTSCCCKKACKTTHTAQVSSQSTIGKANATDTTTVLGSPGLSPNQIQLDSIKHARAMERNKK
jgi:hypothetical protein